MASFDENGPRTKRRRIADDAPVPAPVTITSHKQLRNLLVFQQNISQETKQGVRHFKDFLSSVHEGQEENEKSKKLQILKGYCDSQVVRAGEGNQQECFTDLIQTWAFAESNNDESLLSLVPSVLALFLKTVSSELEFRDFALELCKHLLQKEQLKLFNRGLTASKAKDHLISPCLRLLTEIVCFDGGSVAKIVYAKREVTFKRLDIFLASRKTNTDDEAGDRRQPTLRRIAQRYLLGNFKFQNAAAKAELIGQGKLIRVFLEDIRKDARDMVLEIIKVIDKHIVGDATLTRAPKSRFLNRWNLERLVTLYGFEKESGEPDYEGPSVSDELHKFLLAVCTKTEKGVLLSESGWYPAGSNADVLPNDGDDSIPLGLDSPIHFDKFKDSVPVRNGNLSVLLQFLRPESDTRQMELLLKVFREAPELVSDYFYKRTMFTSDPKPTQSWLGESAFLFSTIQLPVPINCGWKDGSPAMPPPVSIVIENIIPRPLTQKVLTRCMNLNADIITLFAIKTATVALKKLKAVLKVFEANRNVGQQLWNQAAAKLIAEFCKRCPTMKDAILAFRQTPKEDLQRQEVILELLATFYQVIPTVAFEEKFDVSLSLVDVLTRLDDPDVSAEDRKLLFSQLQHILVIAQESPTMRWWQKPESLQLSAFTSVLKVFVEKGETGPKEKINVLLKDVLIQNSVLVGRSSFDALIQSLQGSDENKHSIPWSYIDNCITRLVKKPVPYLDVAKSLLENKSGNLSFLIVTANEQWPFVVKAGNSDNEVATASWLAKLLGSLKSSGEDKTALTNIRDSMAEATQTKKSRSLLTKAFKHSSKETPREGGKSESSTKDTLQNGSSSKAPTINLVEMFGKLPVEDESHAGLHRWEREDVELALDQGHIGQLILCLCSEYEEIRRQAVAGLTRFMINLGNSEYPERQPIYVLIGELLETATEVGVESPLPYIVAELATRMMTILTDPLHKFYGKVNKYLHKAPRWEVGKIPSYWIDKLLFQEPEHDDGHHEEVGWLLDLFINGLRSEKDMEIYRRAGVFERLFALYSSPNLTAPLRKKILHLVFRVCQIGGSTTLLTRSAALSWVEEHVSMLDAHTSIFQALATELFNTCSQDWVNRWSGSALTQKVSGITGQKVEASS